MTDKLKYIYQFFRMLFISNETEHEKNKFHFSRVLLGFILLPFLAIVFAGFYISYLTGKNDITWLIGFAVFAYMMCGIQSFIWSLILEYLYTKKLWIKIIWSLALAIISVTILFIFIPIRKEFFEFDFFGIFPEIFIVYLSFICSSIATVLILKLW